MPNIPQTSITLLQALACNDANSHWYKFYNAYKDPICAFVRSRFPALEPDDILQETMQALSRCLPSYQYTPDEKGHFRNYLMGIVKNKSIDAVRKLVRNGKVIEGYSDDPTAHPIPASSNQEEYRQWQNHAMETAIEQLLADTSLAANTRTIFEHVALLHESPEAVAAQFGTTRNNVDQIKNRLIGRLQELVKALMAEYSPA